MARTCGTHRGTGALVAGVSDGRDAGLGGGVEDGVLAGGGDVVPRAGQGQRGPDQAPAGSASTCTFTPWALHSPE